MYIKVIHRAFEDTPKTVAIVDCPQTNINEALEYAYRYTNNIDGSWSMKIGADANDRVEVAQPLYVDDAGKQWGHRSTSVRDHMEVLGRTYEVANVGFVRLKEVDKVA